MPGRRNTARKSGRVARRSARKVSRTAKKSGKVAKGSARRSVRRVSRRARRNTRRNTRRNVRQDRRSVKQGGAPPLPPRIAARKQENNAWGRMASFMGMGNNKNAVLSKEPPRRTHRTVRDAIEQKRKDVRELNDELDGIESQLIGYSPRGHNEDDPRGNTTLDPDQEDWNKVTAAIETANNDINNLQDELRKMDEQS